MSAVEQAVDALLASPAGAADPWAALVDGLEALVIAAAGASGRFDLVVGWDGGEATPVAIELGWIARQGDTHHGHTARRGAVGGTHPASLSLGWDARDGDGAPAPTAWPTLELPSAAARLLQTVATSRPRPGATGEAKPIVEAEATATGAAGTANVVALGHQVVTAHPLDVDLPAGVTLSVDATLRASGHVSLLTLMAEALKALGSR